MKLKITEKVIITSCSQSKTYRKLHEWSPRAKASKQDENTLILKFVQKDKYYGP